MNRILPEVHQRHDDAQTTRTVFPATCPACGAGATLELSSTSVVDYRRTMVYACGAAYVHKPQIQNHTEKWWGSCPATPEAESMTQRPPCPGVRQKPLDHMSGGPQARGYLKRYGKSKCRGCRGWYVAHKDGTPVYHKVKP